MKILLVADSLARGGMERRLIELIKGLKQYPDIELNLVIFSESIDYPEIYDMGIPVNILKRVPKRNPLVFWKFYKLAKKWRPNLIHCWGTMSAIWAIPTAKLLGIKLINGNIVDAPKDLSYMDKRLFRAKLTFPFSSVIVANSIAGLSAYRVPKRKGVCIYNGIDEQRIGILKDKSEIKEEFKISTAKVVGMIGNFAKRKDYETYILASLRVLEKREDVTFLAVGDGPLLSKCKDLVPSEHHSHIIFTGEREDVESIINILDIGVLATNSHVHGEGISNVILEYMALSKPVIATKGGGTPEIVIPGKTGVLVPPHSAEALATELDNLLENEEQARAMGRVGRETVNKSFSLPKMTEAYVALYKHLYHNN